MRANKTILRKRQEKTMREVAKRAARFGLPGEPSTVALERYIGALDAVRDELAEKYGDDLGTGPNSAAWKLQRERNNALALLAQLKIDKVRPGNFL